MPPPPTAKPRSTRPRLPPPPPLAAHGLATTSLLNVAHAIDHLVLLIFATAVGAIATDFGFARWEDLMPYAAGAFLLFGLGSRAGRTPGRPLGTARDDAGVLLRHRRRRASSSRRRRTPGSSRRR